MTRIARPAKIVERMVNQNTYDEYAQGNCVFIDARFLLMLSRE